MQVERLSDSHDVSRLVPGTRHLTTGFASTPWRTSAATYPGPSCSSTTLRWWSATTHCRWAAWPRTNFLVDWVEGCRATRLGMVLLGRFRPWGRHQGEGLGRDLLIDAVLHAAVAGQHAAARFMAVDPIDESARRFYGRFGFTDIEGDERGRMYIRIDDALAVRRSQRRLTHPSREV